jgi:hypothetical protein
VDSVKIALAAAALVVLAAGPAAAQRRSDLIAPVSTDTVDAGSTTRPRWSPFDRVLARSGGGAAGLVLGSAVGFGVGAMLFGDELASAGGDEGFSAVAASTLVGATVGAGVGAALPRLGAPCSRATRVARGVLGSIAGGAAALVVDARAEREALAIVALAAVGGGVAADC